MPSRTRSSRPAFTLVELAVIVALIGILAASAVPAISGIGDARRSSAWREVERRFVHARARAMAAGRAFGVRVNPVASTFEPLEIPYGGGAPVPSSDAQGQDGAPWSVATAYPGIAVTSFVGGDGSSGTGTLWFGHDGSPQRRDASGVLVGAFSQDAVVTLTGGLTVTVRERSGLIER